MVFSKPDMERFIDFGIFFQVSFKLDAHRSFPPNENSDRFLRNNINWQVNYVSLPKTWNIL